MIAMATLILSLAACGGAAPSSQTPTPGGSRTSPPPGSNPAGTTVTPAATVRPTPTAATPTATQNPATASPSGTAPAKTATIDLTAQGFSFGVSTITVPAGAEVTVNFDNKDSGVTHNFSVYTSSAANQPVFVGSPVTGPGTTTYRFTAPASVGNYYFQCDFHPAQMNGKFIVE